MSFKKTLAVLLGSCLMMSAAQVSAGATGQMLADTCAGCHGTDGVSAGPAIPSLAGYSETYLVDSMNAFKSGDRPGTIMNRIAKGYSEEDIAAMSAVFAKESVAITDQKLDDAQVASGKAIYEDSCEKCHDEKGGLADDDAGILKSQWLPYLRYSMADFKSDAREQPKKMKKKVDKLDDSQLDAVLQYFASQK